MGRYTPILLSVFIFGAFNCKVLHTKQDDSFKQIEVESNLLNNNNAYVEHERFARHVEATVTESIIKHIMQELNRNQPKTKQATSLRQLMRNLKRRLNHYVQKKPHRTKKPIIPKKLWTKVTGEDVKKTI